QEIFALGRDSFQGGQRSFQVQAYPFRMTPANMARHRNNPNMAFWRMIKEGYDAFEVTKAPPKVDVCDKRYVFNARPNDPTQRFKASEACPAYTVPGDIEQAVAAKERSDDAQIASLAPRTPVAPVKTGADGGMHKVFLAQLENPNALRKAPGTLPETVRPPGPRVADQPVPGTAPIEAAAAPAAPAIDAAASVSLAAAPSSVPMPLVRPADAPGGARIATVAVATPVPTRVASAEAPASSGSGSGFLGGLTRLLGGGDTPTGSTGAAPAAAAPAAAPSSGGLLSGLSLGRLFGSGEPASPPPPAAVAAPTAAAAPSDVAVPLPLPRPAVPASAPKPLAAVKPAAPASIVATAPATSAPLPGPPILAPDGFSTAQ
ncbi:MAG: hypothetical protein ACAH27_13925, partial [Xanthobacteraceae bacterium]